MCKGPREPRRPGGTAPGPSSPETSGASGPSGGRCFRAGAPTAHNESYVFPQRLPGSAAPQASHYQLPPRSPAGASQRRAARSPATGGYDPSLHARQPSTPIQGHCRSARLQKSKESRARQSSGCPPSPRTAPGAPRPSLLGEEVPYIRAQHPKCPPSQTPYARFGWRKWGLPHLPRRNLGHRATGLALRAPSSWCQSQDPTLSPPVSTTEKLLSQRGPEVLTPSLLEKEVAGAREHGKQCPKREHWGSSESCNGATHSTG